VSAGNIFVITLIGIVGLFWIVIYPNLPAPRPWVDPCEVIMAKYIGRGLCAKPDGSIWKVP
jgi:hypothetical protein